VPNIVAYVGKVGIETFTRYKWIVLGICIVFLGLAVWIIYLRFLLAKRSIQAQADVEKFRLQLEYEQHPGISQLAYNGKNASETSKLSLPEEPPANEPARRDNPEPLS